MNEIQRTFLQSKKITHEEATKFNMPLVIGKMSLDIIGILMFITTLAFIGCNLLIEDLEHYEDDLNDNSILYVIALTLTTVFFLFIGERITIKK